MSYEELDSELIYSGHIFSIEKIKLTLPDGRAHHYDRINIQNAVTILPIDREGNVFFVRQYRIGANQMLLELPAGKIEDGEEALKTAEREIREETGMAAGKIIPLGKFYVSPGYSTEYMYTFLATDLYDSPLNPDADEFLNLVKIPLAEVKRMVAAGELEDSKSLSTLLLAMPHLDEAQTS